MFLLSLLLATAPPPGLADLGPAPQENLLRGPARCVLRYLEAVRLAGPRLAEVGTRPTRVRAADWDAARRLTAPRALQEIERRASAGEAHPLAFWQLAAARVLEGFQLLSVRRAPLGAAVVTVRETFWRPTPRDAPLARAVSEYLVARVDGAWRVVDRRAGGAFADEELAARYQGWFDAPPAPEAIGPAPDGVPR